MTRRLFNPAALWTTARALLLVSGLTLGAAAYLAPDAADATIGADTAASLAMVLLLLLPVSLVVQLGAARVSRALRASRRRSDIAVARQTLQAWAKRDGWSYHPPLRSDDTSRAVATIDGVQVRVDLEAGDISAPWPGGPLPTHFSILTDPPPEHPPSGMAPFESPNARFNASFRTRLARGGVSPLDSSPKLEQALLRLWHEHQPTVETISLDPHGLICFLGQPLEADQATIARLTAEVAALARLTQTHR